MAEQFSNLYISNSVFTGCTDTCFDLQMIYNYFVITPDYIKIQFNNKQKTETKETDCKTFYNQITFSLLNKASIKLFNNGNFQISGVKTRADATKNLLFVIKDLNSIKGSISVEPEIVQKVCTYNKKIIIKENDKYICKHVYKNGFFIINKEVCVVSDFDDRLLVSNRHINKKKNIYNINCDHIGYLEYEMFRKNKNLCLKDSFFVKKQDDKYSIFNKYTLPLGYMNIYITGEILEHRNLNKVYIDYLACSENKVPEIKSMILANINCNIKYKLNPGDSVDREAICRVLKSKEIDYNYDPCKYPGIKIEHACTKMTIFRTGSILFSGKSNIKDTIIWITELFKQNDFVKKAGEKIEEPEENLSIWDIM